MYFTFDQNNSGGSYERNEDVLEYVIIEAVTALEANCKAEEIGIYFDGCSSGLDCKCCGDRWYPLYTSDATDGPMIYNTNVYEKYVYADDWKDASVVVYTIDGNRFYYKKESK